MDIATVAAAVALIRKSIASDVEQALESSETIKNLEQQDQIDQTAMTELATQTDALIRDLISKSLTMQGAVSQATQQVSEFSGDLSKFEKTVNVTFALLLTSQDAEIRRLRKELDTLKAQVAALNT